MAFDVDAWWKEEQKAMHDNQREELEATCTVCGTDLLDTLTYAAHEESDCPIAVVVSCPECGTEFCFSLTWETILTSARRSRVGSQGVG
jgi:RNase P subunit RPR2